MTELISATNQLPLWQLVALISRLLFVRALIVMVTVAAVFYSLRGDS